LKHLSVLVKKGDKLKFWRAFCFIFSELVAFSKNHHYLNTPTFDL